ncbi:mediator-associated protein 2 isoform X2 [Neltuma alba]|uniref:mediator-associated protein 2 isoform X2 n=1 Tax=Neltuma alba TaxID=207710 RepID=UPI0010A2F1EF|nr:mediator-associated protein 2 isoform X2 [Prosopis alba]
MIPQFAKGLVAVFCENQFLSYFLPLLAETNLSFNLELFDWAMDVEGMEGYRPPPEFEEDTNGPLIDLNLTDSRELWLIQLPSGKDLLTDIEGQELSLKLHGDGQLSSFEGSSGKVYDFISFDTQEADEVVFISSPAEEPKIGKVCRRVSVVHYPDPEELEKVNSNNPRRNSSGTMMTTSSQYFPMHSGKLQSSRSGRAASTQGSRPRSSVSEVGEPSNTSKRRRTAGSEDRAPELSRGHSSGISSASSGQSPGGKSKRRCKDEE